MLAPIAVLHVPHSSGVVPASVRASIDLSDELLSRELLRMTDSFTSDLFRMDPRTARAVVFPVSRLVVDPERFLEDSKEAMAARGMGVIYTRTADGDVLRADVGDSLREHLLATYYKPHHQLLTQAVDVAIGRHGRCLVVDCHSFPSVPLPYEMDQSPDRPDICLGTDPFHTPSRVVAEADALFREEGFSVRLNSPFAGALVPAKHYELDHRVMALMIEVNRGLYMDEATGLRLRSFSMISSRIGRCVYRIIDCARSTPLP